MPNAATTHRIVVVTLAVAMIVGLGCAEPTGSQSEAVFEVDPFPDSVHLEVGEAADFGVRVLDRFGRELPDRSHRVEWSNFDPEIVEISPFETGVSVVALGPGEATLRGKLGRGQGQATVFVPPPGLETIEVVPTPVVVNVGGAVRPSARLLDANGEELDPAGFRFSWQSSDSTVARVPPSFNPQWSTRVAGVSLGETRLRLLVGARWTYVDVRVIPEPPPPPAPTISALSATSLEVVWERVLGANDGYRLYRAAAADGPYTQIAAPGTFDTSHTDAGLAAGTTYFYRLTVCNQHGCSAQSEPGSGTTLSSGVLP